MLLHEIEDVPSNLLRKLIKLQKLLSFQMLQLKIFASKQKAKQKQQHGIIDGSFCECGLFIIDGTFCVADMMTICSNELHINIWLGETFLRGLNLINILPSLVSNWWQLVDCAVVHIISVTCKNFCVHLSVRQAGKVESYPSKHTEEFPLTRRLQQWSDRAIGHWNVLCAWWITHVGIGWVTPTSFNPSEVVMQRWPDDTC